MTADTLVGLAVVDPNSTPEHVEMVKAMTGGRVPDYVSSDPLARFNRWLDLMYDDELETLCADLAAEPAPDHPDLEHWDEMRALATTEVERRRRERDLRPRGA